MKKMAKKLLTACLVCAMALTMLAPAPVEAATTTKSMTMYVGEAFSVTNYLYKVTKVSSTKKSVVKATKNSSDKKYADIYAKKAGKATVTIKTSGGTTKYNITVKKSGLTATLKDLGNGNVLLSVKNKSKQTFDDVEITYTLNDSSGNEVAKDKVTVDDVAAGKTAYAMLYYSTYTYSDVDVSQSTTKVTSLFHQVNYTYTNRTSSVTVTDKTADGDEKITLFMKNKTKADVYVNVNNYIFLYDANDTLLYVKRSYKSLKKGASDTVEVSLPYIGSGVTVDHYEIKTVAYSKAYKG